MENGGYLFTAYAIVWAVVFGYVFVLLGRQRGLRREIDSLKEALKGEKGDQ
ncbi:MAG: CcmD family protein [Dehalococcoidales bacterium]|nr:CcmD family protein [Dehalococcoidales bacterium]